MRGNRNPISGRRKYLWGAITLLFSVMICTGLSMAGNNDFTAARRAILIRKIGHEILLQSGDSISRVLPVEHISENEYQIRFEHDFTFQPDSLVNTTERLLAKDPLVNDYIVNVLNCGSMDVVYGYAISGDGKDDIITCRGRAQPKACYIISIKFKPKIINTVSGKGYLLGSLPLLAFVGVVFFRSVKSKRSTPIVQNTEKITLGSVLFDATKRQLMIDGTPTDLTGTETRILKIFALSPNETIDRSRLQKEIWEDEGVIVGRSLDMFISKLRKKLEPDPDINIVVVRGRGYKLEINA